MLALFFLPAVLALGFFIADGNDDSGDAAEDVPEPSPERDLDLLEESETSGGVFEGTQNAELMVGTDAGSTISGFDGDDIIKANGGDDTIDAGQGDDTVEASDGNDSVTGGKGDDSVSLGEGDDKYGENVWTLEDQLPMAGDDTVSGGAGADTLVDSQGSNVLHGGTGRDFIDARDYGENPGNDTVDGGWGSDTLLIDDGDTATGGNGADYFDLWVKEDRIGEAVTITDFDPDEDALTIFIGRSAEEDSPDITLTHDDTTNIATVLFNEIPVATVLDINDTAFSKMNVVLIG
ncbi:MULTISPECIES: calcium-binding protein [Roseobacteraceae]|uniref:Hemolysin, chromosomal n=1 Tax=Pseudosulfitobacter pseudonitzschiae TaxID=1402135 RepID=A0A221JZB0_9RHOB|nr:MULTISPECIES: calcium-binding protein [Roseobacteraceae]ASM72078.1 hemolysin, chromosomal [Pseudosulfitobacter pseudonitzschiae]